MFRRRRSGCPDFFVSDAVLRATFGQVADRIVASLKERHAPFVDFTMWADAAHGLVMIVAHVHPAVVSTMREVGIDLAGASTTKLSPDIAENAQVLVTMACGDQCPCVPGAKREEWPLEDPKGKPIIAIVVVAAACLLLHLAGGGP